MRPMMSIRFVALALAALLGPLSACGADVPDAPRARVSRRARPANTQPTPPTAATGAVETLSIDPAQSHVAFVAAKVTQVHEGGFREVSGSIEFDSAHATANAIRVRVATASLFADEPRLETHLKSPEFFDVATFPEATFSSTEIRANQPGGTGGTHTVTGDLTMHGQTKRITFPATLTIEGDTVSAGAEFMINRRDFGIIYPGMPDDLIRDSVVLRIGLQAQRPAH